MIDDTELLRRYSQAGSQEAFTELVGRHVGFVYGWALRRVNGNVHSAEDVTQEVFIALANNAAGLAKRTALEGWLYTTTRYVAGTLLRSQRRRQIREQNAEIMNDPPSKTLDAFNAEELNSALTNLLDSLNDRERQAVLLRFSGCHGFSEIGARLDLSKEGARSRVERALEKMRRALARRGITSTAAGLAAAFETQTLAAAPAGLAESVAGAALSASAAATGTGSLLLLFAMNKITVGVASALIVAGAATVFLERHSHRALRVETDGLATGQTPASLNRELETLRSRLLQAEKKQIAAQKQLAPSRQPAPHATRAALEGRAILNQIDYVLAHPELRAAYAQSLAYQLRPAWGERAWALLNVSPDQRHTLTQMLNDYGIATLDARELARANGMTDAEFYPLMAQVTETYFNEAKQVVGESTFQQLQLIATHPIEFNTADQLANSGDPTGPAMTGQQEAQLTGILATNGSTRGQSASSGAIMMGGVPVSDSDLNQMRLGQGDGLMHIALITDAAIAQATVVLPPAQVEALKNLQSLQLAQAVAAGRAPTER